MMTGSAPKRGWFRDEIPFDKAGFAAIIKVLRIEKD
jgi:hypothetical protein